MLRNRVLYKKESGPIDYIEIAGVKWALENEGTDETHPYGLLYQYGRQYGQGYSGEAPSTDIYQGPVDPSFDILSNQTHFYKSDNDWRTPSLGTTYNDIYGEWRLPTITEANTLLSYGYSTGNKNGLIGIFLGPNHDNETLRLTQCLFIPFAGKTQFNSGLMSSREQFGMIWLYDSTVAISGSVLYVSNALVTVTSETYRAMGASVRLVKK